MSIYETYLSVLTEKIIRDFLSTDIAPTTGQIDNALSSFTSTYDLSQPLFLSSNYKVAWREYSSATKWNNCNATIRQDLDVLYKELYQVSDRELQNFSRWKTEATLLEQRLDILQRRIETLLLLSRDTAGYFNYMQDNFYDTTRADLSNTTAYVNTNQNIVTIGTSNLGATKIDTSYLVKGDVTFTVLSRNGYVTDVPADGSDYLYAFNPKNNSSWQSLVKMSSPSIVTVEFKVDLKTNHTISRIDMSLHQANNNSSVQVTPMLSTDDYNYSQLNTAAYSQALVGKGSFIFPPIETRYIKFVIVKRGFDLREASTGNYIYEFGADEISFYNEGFAANTEAQLVSNPLSVLDQDKNPIPFSKVVLEVCENVPDNTSIDYYLAADTGTTAYDELAFVSIDPLSRTNTTRPKLLDFGDIASVSVSGIGISFDAGATDKTLVNPSQVFYAIDTLVASLAIVDSGHANAQRYSLQNKEDRILTHIIASGLRIADNSLELWRNVAKQGYGDTNTVRNVRAGWGFSDPYYSTTVYVENATGMNVDFGTNPVMMDGRSVVGKVNVPTGKHVMQVHKSKWQTIDSTTVVDLTSLKAADPLYPYNQRYVIEGYPYPNGWLSEKIYMGFDLMAQYFMKEVSVFELLHNVPSDGYQYFARDYQADTANYTNATVFLLKCDAASSDFLDEDFLLKFKAVNSQATYIRFKAVLNTTDSKITPYLDSYRVKIAN